MKLRHVVGILSIVVCLPVSAATRTWNGSVSASWSVAANWDEGAAPAAGDDLVFKAGASNLTNNDNIPVGTVFRSITFQAGGYTIQGNSFGLTAGITCSNGNGTNTIQPGAPGVAIMSNQTISVAAGGTLTISGNVSIGAGLTLGIQSDGDLTLSGVVAGSGGIAKGGLGTLTLGGNNTYTGLTVVGQGMLLATNSSALGSAAFGGQILSGATLALQGNINVPEPISINGSGVGSAGVLLSVSGNNTYSGSVTLNSTFDNRVGVGAGSTFTVSGPLSSPAAATTPLTKVGAGTLVLPNANTYAGLTTVLVGDVNVRNASALGDVANGTVVAFGAALDIQNGITLPEPLSLNGLGITSTGSFRSISGGNTVTGAVTLSSDAAIGADSGSTLTVQGNMDGTANLRKAGAGTLILSGTNTYSGTTSVFAGVLRAQSGSALGLTSAGTAVMSGAALELSGPINIGDESLDVSGTGIANAGALRNIAGANGWAGPITLSGPTSVNVVAGSLNATGAIGGANALTKTGAGTLLLSGTNTYTGGTLVSAGTLVANGTLDTGSTVQVSPGATLMGSGSLGVIADGGGTVAPGQSPGILSATGLSFNAGSTYSVEVGGTAPGTGYDQIDVSNPAVTLGGANLGTTIIPGFAPPPLSTYAIINAAGAASPSGIFAGLPEGAFLTIGGFRFQISYAGGVNSNDVVLTRIPVTKTWTGAISNLWSVGANWMGGAPVSGDDLVFPAAAMNLNNTNDFPAGFAVNSITISGTGYTLHTNQGVLYNGITATNPNGTNAVDAGGSLAQAQTFLSTNAASTLMITGSLAWNGFDLTFDGAGSTIVSGASVLAGSGNLVKMGTGTLTINGTNSYTGTTLVNAGVVNIQADGALGTGASAVTVAGSGAAIQVQGSINVSKPLVLNGGGVGGTGAIQVLSGTSSWTGPVQLASATQIEVDSGQLSLDGVVSGSGSLLKTNSGRLVLTGANTFTGAVTAATGPLRITNASALGATSNGIFLVSSTLEVAGDIAVGAELLTFSSAGATLRSVSGTNSWAGDVTLQTGGAFSADPGSQLAVNGVISGSFPVQKSLLGTIVFGGANTYTGSTIVSAGVLGITNGSALGTGAGSTTVLSGAALQVEGMATGIIVTNEFLALNGSGPGGAGALQSVNGPNGWNSTISLVTADATIAAGAGSTLIVGGFVTNSGGLTKIGPGRLTLLANNNYAGSTTVNGGTLLVNGAQTQGAAVNAGATLGGAGSVGSVTSTSGTISPGQSPGILSTGGLTLDAGSTFSVELDGTTPGTGYDRVSVAGSVTLGGATLNVTVGYTPSSGDSFTIIQNDGTLDPVSGTFAGLVDGAMFAVGSFQFQIFYTGGDGNDVVLHFVGCVTDTNAPTVTPPADTTMTQTLCV